jgi:hypothetical protein
VIEGAADDPRGRTLCDALSSADSEEMAVDVGSWLRSLGLECYAAAFRENAVSAVVLPTQTADDQVPSRLAIAVRS